jgi:hypothetical protein|tara:strand:- start:3596 stop:4483 length:888 start_codon:yes stop_codon:yes gene_type:complete
MGRPVSDNLIKSGPQKLINNVIKISKLTDAFVLNKHISENYYFINFDENNFLTIEKILQDKNSKVIVGPLYNQKDLKILAKLSLQYNNLKIVVASSSAKEDLEQITGLSVSNQVSILPVGVYSESEIFNFQNQRKLIDNYQFDCLIYFKNRELKSLNEIINFLKNKNIRYKVLTYGDYKNKQLVKYALKSKFGLILGSTESQGIAINELMATNLPLFVIDKNINNYENIKLYGTTVPYWSSECGEKILDLNDFKMNFQRFLKNYESNTYKPNNLINEKLSFEKFIENIQLEFLKF